MTATYRTLDAGKIIATADALKARIDERFPGSGLCGVAAALAATAQQTRGEALALARRIWGLRLLPALFIAACLEITFIIAHSLQGAREAATTLNTETTNLLMTLDSTVNTIVLAGAAVFFLATVEARLKRRRALRALHQLRSLMQVIDMHQLTKDPSLVLGERHDTRASPKRMLTPFELGRYLDYCSEMLSLTGKVAALYAQDFDDAVVIAAVNDIEMLATNLSHKIWQKIAILQAAIQGAE
jgi:hypothetical protein